MVSILFIIVWQNKMEIYNGKLVWIADLYRRFWLNQNSTLSSNISFKDKILKEVPKDWHNYDVILANKISMDDIKFMKIIKYGKLALFNNPKSIF